MGFDQAGSRFEHNQVISKTDSVVITCLWVVYSCIDFFFLPTALIWLYSLTSQIRGSTVLVFCGSCVFCFPIKDLWMVTFFPLETRTGEADIWCHECFVIGERKVVHGVWFQQRWPIIKSKPLPLSIIGIPQHGPLCATSTKLNQFLQTASW